MKTLTVLLLCALTLSAEAVATCSGCSDYGPIKGLPDWSMSYGSRMVWTVGGLDNGVYVLTLTFVEPIYTTVGQRPLNVLVNDLPMLSGFDVITAGGPNTPVTRSMVVAVTDGKILIVLTANSTIKDGKVITHSAILSGLKVRPLLDAAE